MNYQQKDWLGSWQNFENYLVSTAPAMQACWTQAEEAAKALPMFQAGVKTFWQRACGTALAGPVLGGWQIEAANAQDLRIIWLDAAGQPLDSAVYHFTGALEKGLEGKVCAKFETAGALQHPQFRCLLAMPPMPERTARAHGGLLSHLHFQYAAGWTALVGTDGKLSHPCWSSATLCEPCTIWPAGPSCLCESCRIAEKSPFFFGAKVNCMCRSPVLSYN